MPEKITLQKIVHEVQIKTLKNTWLKSRKSASTSHYICRALQRQHLQ